MRKIFLLSSCIVFTTIIFAQQIQHKIVFDFTKGDTANAATLMRQCKNILIASPDAKLEIVCHGPGLDLITKNITTVQKEVEELHDKYNVNFAACEATMKRRGVDKSQLFSFAKTVPLANLEISSKEQQGWSYIKAGY